MNAGLACNKIPEIQHHIDRNLDPCVITKMWIKQEDKAVLSTLPPKGYLIKYIPKYDQTGKGVC